MGGLAVRHSPTGWKQAQGDVGTLQSNLYAQVRALKLVLEARYPGFDLPTKHLLFPWLVKHAQWLLNRYAQKSDGPTPFEKRWSKPYSGSLCLFAEVVHFRKVGKFPKSLPAWEEGLWLGRDTESNQHFVATRRPQDPLTSSASAVRAGSKRLAGVTSGKAVGSQASREETDHFVFPPLGPRSASQRVQPLGVDGSQLLTVEEEPAEEVEHFHDLQLVSESRTSADLCLKTRTWTK